MGGGPEGVGKQGEQQGFSMREDGMIFCHSQERRSDRCRS